MAFLTYETGDENLGWVLGNIIELPLEITLTSNSAKLKYHNFTDD